MKTETTMARGCYGRSKKKLKVKNWKETAKGRKNGRDLVENAKTHKGLQCQIMTMMMMMMIRRPQWRLNTRENFR